MHYKVIILDFDGVLVESNAIKDKAIEYVFADQSQYLDEIIKYQRSVTLIRYAKFKHIVEEILKKPYTQVEEQRLSKLFSAFCVKQIIACPWVAGAKEFLDYFKNRLPLYVVSMSPVEDLKEIIDKREMGHYFKAVYAVNAAKEEKIQEIFGLEHLKPEEAVYIGDTKSDLIAAQKAGVAFIGRRDQYDFFGISFPIFEDMFEIKEYLREQAHG